MFTVPSSFIKSVNIYESARQRLFNIRKKNNITNMVFDVAGSTEKSP